MFVFVRSILISSVQYIPAMFCLYSVYGSTGCICETSPLCCGRFEVSPQWTQDWPSLASPRHLAQLHLTLSSNSDFLYKNSFSAPFGVGSAFVASFSHLAPHSPTHIPTSHPPPPLQCPVYWSSLLISLLCLFYLSVGGSDKSKTK